MYDIEKYYEARSVEEAVRLLKRASGGKDHLRWK